MTLDPKACYAAHLGRDARFDGVFFTAVKTTGIYCRPVCPARTPAASSCQFFPTASAAEAAGFRPCLRCRPELAPGRTSSSFAEALMDRIQQRATEGIRLGDLEADLGVSSRQLRRILWAEYGVTPLQVIQTRRLLLAKQWLHDTAMPVNRIALASGFRSLRAFNTAFVRHYRIAPHACRKQNSAEVSSGSVTLHLSYREPFAWHALLAYFRGRLIPGVEEIMGNEYRRTLAIGHSSGWLRINPSTRPSSLAVEISAELVPVLGRVQSLVRQVFDLDARPDVIAAHLGRDPLLAPILAAHPGLRIAGAWDPFELAIRAVLGQQITVKAATTLSARLANKIGQPMVTPFPNLNRLAITASSLNSLAIEPLQALGITRTRGETLRHLAELALRGGFRFSVGETHDQVTSKLIAIPGIGPWTANYIALRALRFPDSFPAADLGLRKAVGRETIATTRDTLARAEAWRPWRSYAAIALWQSLT
ncbi:MAG: AlkA N-terminal domain-containing protein [Verrucomicrobiota bacterium]